MLRKAVDMEGQGHEKGAADGQWPPIQSGETGEEDQQKKKSILSGLIKAPSVAQKKQLAENQVEFPPQPYARYPVFNPHSTERLRWDFFLLLLILYVLITTPFELSFVSEFPISKLNDPNSREYRTHIQLYVLNKCVDACFLVDLFLEFNMAFFHVRKGKWIIDRNEIARKYLKTWFPIDVLSLLPYGDLPLSKETGFIRLVRLVRLMKMLRVLKNPRIFARIAKRITLRTGTQAIIKYVLLLFLIFHWSACVLRVIDTILLDSAADCRKSDIGAILDDGLVDALSEIADDDTAFADEADCPDVALTRYWSAGIWGQYAEAVEFAVATLNSDMRGENISESIFSITLGIVGCYVLAFLVGDLCNVITNLSPVKNDFRLTIDSLNDYLDENQIPDDMRRKLREYMVLSESVFRENYYRGLLSRLSPGLRSVVANHNLARVVKKLPFFQFVLTNTYPIHTGTRVVVAPPVTLPTDRRIHPGGMSPANSRRRSSASLLSTRSTTTRDTTPTGYHAVLRSSNYKNKYRRAVVSRVAGDLRFFDCTFEDTGETESAVPVDRIAVLAEPGEHSSEAEYKIQRRLGAMVRERDQFVVTMASMFETQLYMPRDTLVYGDLSLNTSMYVVNSGKCLIFGRNKAEVLFDLEIKAIDDVIGDDICMLTVGRRRPVTRHYTAIVCALTQVHAISGKRFADMIASGSFPVFSAHVRICGCWQHIKRSLVCLARKSMNGHGLHDDPMLAPSGLAPPIGDSSDEEDEEEPEEDGETTSFVGFPDDDDDDDQGAQPITASSKTQKYRKFAQGGGGGGGDFGNGFSFAAPTPKPRRYRSSRQQKREDTSSAAPLSTDQRAMPERLLSFLTNDLVVRAPQDREAFLQANPEIARLLRDLDAALPVRRYS